MKRLFMTLAVALTLLTPAFAMSGQAAAANVFNNCGGGSAGGTPTVCADAQRQGTQNDPIINIIKAAINVLSFIIGIAVIITIVVSGVRFITSGGNSESVASARSGLIYALIGAAVVILAQALVAFVLDKVK